VSAYLIMDYRDTKEPLSKVIESLVQQHMEAALRAECLGQMLLEARLKQAKCEMLDAGIEKGDEVVVNFSDGEEVCELVGIEKGCGIDVRLSLRRKTQKGKWCKTTTKYRTSMLKHMKRVDPIGANA
jgi:hypothetical protein